MQETIEVLPQFSAIAQAVIDGDPEQAKGLVQRALAEGQSPLTLFDELTAGIREVGDLFGRGEYFLPDLMLGAKAINAGNALVQAALSKEGVEKQNRGKILLGTVKGDLHDIGKSLVRLMLETNGYDVRDLGTDVSSERFIEEAQTFHPDVIGLSSLLTTTARYQRTLIEALEETGQRQSLFVIVGGAATSAAWANEITADGWAENATDAVELVDRLMHRAGRDTDRGIARMAASSGSGI
jgi:corrinoid protein of di/trimethylamine methyltransferase